MTLEQDNIEVTNPEVTNPEVTDPEIIADELEKDPEDWQPDYRFKVMDEEKEIPEYFRPVITKDNYDEVKGLFEKAYGLDYVKQKKSSLEEENRSLNEIKSKFEEQNNLLGYMGSLLKNKQYHTLFSQLKIPEKEVMSYALDRARYQDLSPDEKIAYDRGIEEKERLLTLEKQNQDLQEQFNQQAIQTRIAELDNILSSGQMAQIVQDFDQRAGKPGAFKEEVIKRGQLAYYQSGQDISAHQAVEEVVRLAGGNVQSHGVMQNQQVLNTPQVQQPQASVVTQPKPTIPNFQGSGSRSPSRKLPTSIDDLKRAAEAMY